MARQKEFNQEEVLEQAMRLFWENGYKATSIRDLLKATGISSSSLYEAFGDKRGLFLTALARFCALEQASVTQIAASAPTPPVFIEQLFTQLDGTLPMSGFPRGSLALNAMAEFGTLDTDVTQLLLAHYFAIAEIIHGALKRGQAEHTITNPAPPLHLAYTILSTLHGVAMLKGVRPDFAYIPAVTRVILSLLNP